MIRSLRCLFVATVLLFAVAEARAQNCEVQFINNFGVSSATVFAAVDLYIGDVKRSELDDFDYRTATPFIELRANRTYTLTLASSGSTFLGNQTITFTETEFLLEDRQYVFMIHGISGTGFENPVGGRDIGVAITMLETRDQVDVAGSVEFVSFNGITDAIDMDIVSDFGAPPLLSNFNYGVFNGYISIDPEEYVLTLTETGVPENIQRGFIRNLTNLANQPVVLFSSGFITPENEPDIVTDDFKANLFVARRSGQVLPFQERGSFVQFVHNAPFPDAAVVDMYVNGEKNEDTDDFEFRTATPFEELRSGDEVNVAIANDESENPDDDVVAEFSLGKLIPNRYYTVFANGILGGGWENGDPGNRDIELDLIPVEVAMGANDPSDVDVFTFDGCTDCPSIDLYTNLLASPDFIDVDYGMASGPRAYNPDAFVFTITENDSKVDQLGRYFGDLRDYAGDAIVFFTSGFLTTANEPVNVPPSYELRLMAALPSGEVLTLPFAANMQIVHNAADPSLSEVDVYVNGLKRPPMDDLGFRKATPFMTVPAEVPLDVVIANKNSSGPGSSVLKQFDLDPLDRETSYVAFANGVMNEDFENPDPGVRDISLNVIPNIGREESAVEINTEFFVFHGVSDAGPVDIYRSIPGEPLVADLDYGEGSDYASLAPERHVLTLTEAGDIDAIIGNYVADLDGLAGQSAAVFASGFATPGNEPVAIPAEYGFGIFAAFPDGSVVNFPEEVIDAAKVQIINNSGLPAAGPVDIYVDGKKSAALDDLGFRAATPYLDLPANQALDIVIAEGGSTRADDRVLKRLTIDPLTKDAAYVMIVNGTDDEDYENGDPGNRDIRINLFQMDGRVEAINPAGLEFFAFHGLTDAPAVDIYVDDADDPIAAGIDYGMASSYQAVPPAEYTLTVTAAGDRTSIVGAYIADVTGLEGRTMVIFASGFLTLDGEPGNVPSDYTVGFFAAFPDGNVIRLPEAGVETAQVQIIHNSADPVAAEVDVYLNGGKRADLDDFGFRSATTFFPIPAGENIELTVAAPGSTGPDDQVVETIQIDPLDADGRYVIIISGVVGDGFNNPDPGNRNINLDVYPVAANEDAQSPNLYDLFVFHGATDAPAIDLYTNINGNPEAANLDYGDNSEYLSFMTSVQNLTVTAAGDKSTVVGIFQADFTGLQGQTGVIVVCGFLTSDDEPGEIPSDYQLALCLVQADGSVTRLDAVSSVAEPQELAAGTLRALPNPASISTTLRYTLTVPAEVELTVVNSIGQIVARFQTGWQNAGEHSLKLDASGWAAGMYSCRLTTATGTAALQFVVTK